MKKTSAIFLLIVFAFNLGGYVLLHGIQKTAIRREIRAAVRRGDESLFRRLDASDTQLALAGDDEIRYKGEYYDIVRTEKKEGHTYYIVIADKKDTELSEAFCKSGNKGDSTLSERIMQEMKVMMTFYPNHKPPITGPAVSEAIPSASRHEGACRPAHQNIPDLPPELKAA